MKLVKQLPKKEKERGFPQINNSCGSQGCNLQPYIMPFLGKKAIPFTPYTKKAA